MKNIVITGSAGFLGQAIYKAFEGDYQLRLVDVADFETGHEKMIGDVSDFSFCQEVVRGMDILVVAHMMSRPYPDDPSRAFQVNVTGTANLFHAAMHEGIKRACLISSTGVVSAHNSAENKWGQPPVGQDVYSATKACQEVVAESCHVQCGMEVVSMRLGYVVDLKGMVDKYGRALSGAHPGMVDRHDVGIMARKFLEIPDLGYRALPVFSVSPPGYSTD